MSVAKIKVCADEVWRNEVRDMKLRKLHAMMLCFALAVSVCAPLVAQISPVD